MIGEIQLKNLGHFDKKKKKIELSTHANGSPYEYFYSHPKYTK